MRRGNIAGENIKFFVLTDVNAYRSRRLGAMCRHSALRWMTPSEFAEKFAGCQNMQPD